MRQVFLDLFCGAGGGADGYREAIPASVEIIGVDIHPQPRYPFDFVQTDVIHYLDAVIRRELSYRGKPAHIWGVHASPPCQRFSDLAARWGNRDDHPDLVDPVRQRLRRLDCPWAIENVPEAPLHPTVVLCGTMFRGLRVIRHRAFETNFAVPGLIHRPHPLVYTRDRRKAHYGQLDEWQDFITVTGGGNSTVAAALDAMGIDRPMTKAEVNEAIPPVYGRHVGLAMAAARRSYAWRSARLHEIFG